MEIISYDDRNYNEEMYVGSRLNAISSREDFKGKEFFICEDRLNERVCKNGVFQILPGSE